VRRHPHHRDSWQQLCTASQTYATAQHSHVLLFNSHWLVLDHLNQQSMCSEVQKQTGPQSQGSLVAS
jgi:hypothetical protein